MQVRKAIIPAAGLGSRMLPASKAVPKEMIPLVDKPAIQYIVEEAVRSGIDDILIITNRGKEAIEDHFDYEIELEQALSKSGKTDLLEEVQLSAKLANIYFIRQKEIRGLGHAVYTARSFVGDEPFVVLYGDDVIYGDIPATKQLIDASLEYGLPSLAIKEVPPKDISRYSSLSVAHIKENLYMVDDMIEKPAFGEHLSFFSILGRCLLTPDIFPILETLPPGSGGEIQLTDAIRILAKQSGCIGVDFIGKHYDIGSKLGVMKAQVEIALAHEEIGSDFKSYLHSLSLRSNHSFSSDRN